MIKRLIQKYKDRKELERELRLANEAVARQKKKKELIELCTLSHKNINYIKASIKTLGSIAATYPSRLKKDKLKIERLKKKIEWFKKRLEEEKVWAEHYELKSQTL